MLFFFLHLFILFCMLSYVVLYTSIIFPRIHIDFDYDDCIHVLIKQLKERYRMYTDFASVVSITLPSLILVIVFTMHGKEGRFSRAAA